MLTAGEWREELHPRDDHGRFAIGEGGLPDAPDGGSRGWTQEQWATARLDKTPIVPRTHANDALVNQAIADAGWRQYAIAGITIPGTGFRHPASGLTIRQSGKQVRIWKAYDKDGQVMLRMPIRNLGEAKAFLARATSEPLFPSIENDFVSAWSAKTKAAKVGKAFLGLAAGAKPKPDPRAWEKLVKSGKIKAGERVDHFNPHHAPAGSPEGGQFTAGDGGAVQAALAATLKKWDLTPAPVIWGHSKGYLLPDGGAIELPTAAFTHGEFAADFVTILNPEKPRFSPETDFMQATGAIRYDFQGVHGLRLDFRGPITAAQERTIERFHAKTIDYDIDIPGAPPRSFGIQGGDIDEMWKALKASLHHARESGKIKAGEWREELHPRDDHGKFAVSGTLRSGVADAVQNPQVRDAANTFLKMSGRVQPLVETAARNLVAKMPPVLRTYFAEHGWKVEVHSVAESAENINYSQGQVRPGGYTDEANKEIHAYVDDPQRIGYILNHEGAHAMLSLGIERVLGTPPDTTLKSAIEAFQTATVEEGTWSRYVGDNYMKWPWAEVWDVWAPKLAPGQPDLQNAWGIPRGVNENFAEWWSAMEEWPQDRPKMEERFPRSVRAVREVVRLLGEPYRGVRRTDLERGVSMSKDAQDALERMREGGQLLKKHAEAQTIRVPFPVSLGDVPGTEWVTFEVATGKVLRREVWDGVPLDTTTLRAGVVEPLTAGEWDPAKHPKWPAGTEGGKGGQFAPSDTATADVPQSELERAGQGRFPGIAAAPPHPGPVAVSLERESSDHGEPPVIPDEWDMLTGDMQEQAKDKWLERNRSEYVRNEVDYWEQEYAPAEALRWMRESDDTQAQDYRRDDLVEALTDAGVTNAQAAVDAFLNVHDTTDLAQIVPEVEAGYGIRDADTKAALRDFMDDNALVGAQYEDAHAFWNSLEFEETAPYAPSPDFEGQGTLPGIDAPDPRTWRPFAEEVLRDYQKRLMDHAEREIGDAVTADMQQIGEQVDEYMDQAWDEKTDRDKFAFARDYLDTEIFEYGYDAETGDVLRSPWSGNASSESASPVAPSSFIDSAGVRRIYDAERGKWVPAPEAETPPVTPAELEAAGQGTLPGMAPASPEKVAFLSSARIPRTENLGGGISTTFIADIEGDGRAIVKPENGYRSGSMRGNIEPRRDIDRELAAQIVNEALGHVADISAVAERVFKPGEVEGQEVEGRALVREYREGRPPGDYTHIKREDIDATAFFDSVIGNLDRHPGQGAVDEEGHLVPFDHDLSFPRNNTGSGNLDALDARLNGRGRSRENPMRLHEDERQRLDRLVQQRATLDRLLGSRLKGNELNAFWERVNWMRESGRVFHPDHDSI